MKCKRNSIPKQFLGGPGQPKVRSSDKQVDGAAGHRRSPTPDVSKTTDTEPFMLFFLRSYETLDERIEDVIASRRRRTPRGDRPTEPLWLDVLRMETTDEQLDRIDALYRKRKP